jgi:sulfite reductase subunit B
MKTIYTPEIAIISKVVPQTDLETLFEIELTERKTLGHTSGQFVEISIFGVGEAPICVSSAPDPGRPSFELCVRKVGGVTSALHKMKPGDKVGIRGPFGNGFDAGNFKGKDILFIAGGTGLFAVRAFILEVLKNRKDYGKVYILYGCKTPKDLLFKDELAAWEKMEGVEYLQTVDLADEDWIGNVGVITTLIPRIDIDPNKTQAIIVGPPIMYRFVISELKSRRMPEKNIWMSLERRMKCGLGKCGHCQMNQVYVCQDGPVFNYSDLRNMPEAI